jgi:hypothetical protein
LTGIKKFILISHQALLLASPSFNRLGSLSDQQVEPERVQQVDIVPTLSMLFGTGIPPASIGVAIQSALKLSFGDQKPHNVHLEAALRNHAVQLTTLLQQVLGGISPVKAFLHLGNIANENEDLEAIISRLDVDRVRNVGVISGLMISSIIREEKNHG